MLQYSFLWELQNNLQLYDDHNLHEAQQPLSELQDGLSANLRLKFTTVHSFWQESEALQGEEGALTSTSGLQVKTLWPVAPWVQERVEVRQFSLGSTAL